MADDRARSLAWGWVGIGGAVFALLGSLLTWVTVESFLGSIEIAGTKGDGKITLVLALAAGAALLAAIVTESEANAIAGGVVASIGAAVAVYDMANTARVAGGIDSPFVRVDIGVGLYFCVVGFAAAVVGAFVMRAGLTTTKSPTANPEG